MIIWIASYPKSGNTWIRSLLCAYLFSKDGKFNFNLLGNIKQFSSKNFLSSFKNPKKKQIEIFENWIPSQTLINKDKKIHFFKTHNALCTINGNKFTDELNTKAAIYIVRDPRNIITSLSHHYEINLEESFQFLVNKKKTIFPIDFTALKVRDSYNDVNVLGDWSGHYKSWKNIGFCPIKIIKYEDILTDTNGVFVSILEFLSKFIEIKIEKNKIHESLNSTSFDALRKMEKEQGFVESTISNKTKQKINFFNLGKKNSWEKILDKKIVEKINNAFKDEMRELNYL
tara:strand:+ start:211 stop:1068 length:858 start_codon:yes stop_codon:yes gene_type:complete